MTSAEYMMFISGIMIASGCLGGLVNYLMLDSERASVRRLLSSLSLGLASALIVPLFLKMIASDLLQQGMTNPLDLFVFGGFCLVAAISSRSFIHAISNRVLKEARAARSQAEEAYTRAETATGAVHSAERKLAIALAYPSKDTDARSEMALAGNPGQRLELLATQYNEIRSVMRFGPTRTTILAGIVRSMIDISPTVGDLPIDAYLDDVANAGHRLLGYARLYSKPDAAYLDQLVRSVLRIEDKPFGQYWGIVAIGRILEENEALEIDATLIDTLRSFQKTLPRSTDRHYELSRILESYDAADIRNLRQ